MLAVIVHERSPDGPDLLNGALDVSLNVLNGRRFPG